MGHGDACAPGILAKLRPVRERGGVVLELGCGSGALTRHLVAAGYRVIATEASPAMLALARGGGAGRGRVRKGFAPLPRFRSRPSFSSPSRRPSTSRSRLYRTRFLGHTFTLRGLA